MTEGITIGVFAGVFVGLILELFRYTRRVLNRREQIKYLRRYISRVMKFIREADDATHPGYSGDALRYSELANFQEEMEILLGWRATALTYKQLSSLQQLTSDIKRTTSRDYLSALDVVSLDEADKLFKDMEKLKWLKLQP